MADFKLVSPFQPTGDQPTAIAKLVEGIRRGNNTGKPSDWAPFGIGID